MSSVVLALHIDELGLAIEVDAVQEIADPPPRRALPQAPPHLAGLASLRGTPLPLVDLGVLVDQAPVADRATRVVVMGLGDGTRAGFLVSRISGVVAAPARRAARVPMSSGLRAIAQGEIDTPAGVLVEIDPRALFEVARAR